MRIKKGKSNNYKLNKGLGKEKLIWLNKRGIEEEMQERGKRARDKSKSNYEINFSMYEQNYVSENKNEKQKVLKGKSLPKDNNFKKRKEGMKKVSFLEGE